MHPKSHASPSLRQSLSPSDPEPEPSSEPECEAEKALQSEIPFEEFKALVGKNVRVPRSWWTDLDEDCKLDWWHGTVKKAVNDQGSPAQDKVPPARTGG